MTSYSPSLRSHPWTWVAWSRGDRYGLPHLLMSFLAIIELTFVLPATHKYLVQHTLSLSLKSLSITFAYDAWDVHHKLLVGCNGPWVLRRASFRLWWRSALVGQKIEPKTRLFEAMVGTTDEMEKKKKKLNIYKLDFSRYHVYCLRVWGCSRNLISKELP